MFCKNLTAIIVTFNSEKIIENCLSNLAKQKISAIIVDNGSNDATIEIARRCGAKIIENNTNLGFGIANNIGVKACETKYAMIINPDIQIENGFLSEIENATQKYGENAIYAPSIFEEHGNLFYKSKSFLSPEYLNHNKSKEPLGDVCLPFLSGACFIISRAVFLELGGFDENIFLYYEDDDFCRRAWDNKTPLIHINEAKVTHLAIKSTSHKKGRVFRGRYHLAWSKNYVSQKYGQKCKPISDMLRNGIKYIFAVLTFNSKRKERYGGSFMGDFDFVFDMKHKRDNRIENGRIK